MTSRSKRVNNGAVNAHRMVLSPLSPNSQLPSSSPEVRTYSRKRKRIDEEPHRRLARSSNVNDIPTVYENDKLETMPGQKTNKQTNIASFFNRPTVQLPTPDSSPATSSPSHGHKTCTKSSSTIPVMTQLHLSNLGPSTRTSIHCKICQMHYNRIDPHDIKLHKTHHTAILNGPQFTKPPIPTNPLSNSPILPPKNLIIISRSCNKETQKRTLQLLSTIDLALGAPFINRATFFPRDGKVYIIVSSNRVISLVAAERLDVAYRRIPGNGVETTRVKERALIGISRMWTCIAERGKGWCCALLEECAAGFVWGVDCRGSFGGKRGMRDFVAFSTPSESGMGVAKKWTKREDFLVYDD